ncbi:MAG TPA: HAMP domain-containing sensor histidine kinase [Thermoanaerobaculia bacterium]|nr:HAMP domain-containing sensor histidine kinase [Thermoanaerobaculia bacterium]
MAIASRLRSLREKDGAYRRAPIVLPFVIITAALLILANRSYQLSIQMERSLDSLAIQYLEYASEITAQRTDAASRAETFRVSEQWQQIERLREGPSFGSLQKWLKASPWVISAIYVPDADPTQSVYVTSAAASHEDKNLLASEFYTASGSVRYTYDPHRLLLMTASGIWKQPLARSSSIRETTGFREQSQIRLIPKRGITGLVNREVGPAVITSLAPPLNGYAIEASIRSSYVGTGWHSVRVISLWFAGFAVLVVAAGAFAAMRGLEKEAEAMQLRGALIANVSHELRTPLSMIRLGAETLKRSTRLTAKERADLQESILREVLHLSHLVENVLDVARLQKAAPRTAFSPVDPVQLVRSVITTYESWISNKGFSVQLDLDLSVEEQSWDREAVSRALVNLIDNAIKYSINSNNVEVSLSQGLEFVVLAVKDHGIGIRAQDLSKIFDPYFRAAFSDTETRRGAGLGLTLVQQIVAAHGGRVEVESRPGEGSCFRLLFPKRTAAARSSMNSALVSRQAQGEV